MCNRYHPTRAEIIRAQWDFGDVPTGDKSWRPGIGPWSQGPFIRARKEGEPELVVGQWALIAFDDVGMVFARRNAFPPKRLAPIEYRYLVPDDPSIGYVTAQIRDGARNEVVRAKAQFGDIRVVQELERGVAGN